MKSALPKSPPQSRQLADDRPCAGGCPGAEARARGRRDRPWDGVRSPTSVAPVLTVVQELQRGTADAVMAARDALNGFTGDVLVLHGDLASGRSSETTLGKLLAERRRANAAVAVIGMWPEDEPVPAYGRLVLGKDGTLDGGSSQARRTPVTAQRQITLCKFLRDGDRRQASLVAARCRRQQQREERILPVNRYRRHCGVSRARHACAAIEAPVEEMMERQFACRARRGRSGDAAPTARRPRWPEGVTFYRA